MMMTEYKMVVVGSPLSLGKVVGDPRESKEYLYVCVVCVL